MSLSNCVALSLVLLMTGLLGIASLGGAVSAPPPCPSDLHVLYEWKAGTMPPPYHYEYSIEIAATGEGKVIYVPDYPSEKAPVWTEGFAVDSGALQRLCEKMAAEGLWTEQWQPPEIPLLGGSSESVVVKGNQRTVSLPSLPAGRQKERAKAIFEAIKSLVPQSLWTKLEEQRDRYRLQRYGEK